MFTPKSLLRARQARSPIGAFTSGSFAEVLDDPAAADEGFDAGRGGPGGPLLGQGGLRRPGPPGRARRRRAERWSVVRVEQLYPWPKATIKGVLDRYANAREVVWLQEEPENMGAWNFVHGRLHRLLRDTHTLRHVSRAESASPASGSAALHRLEQDDLLAAPSAEPSAWTGRPARPSAQEVVGQGDPHLGGEMERLDVDPLVDAVEHGPVLLEADGPAVEPEAVGHAAEGPVEAGVGGADGQEGHRAGSRDRTAG